MDYTQNTLFQSEKSLNSNENLVKPSERLLHVFEDIHNYMYANDGLSAQQSFEQVLIILFLKIFDENTKEEPLFYIDNKEYEQVKDGSIPNSFLERFNLLKDRTFKYYSDFLEDEKVNLKLPTLAYIFQKLQNINLRKSSRDIKGLAFQKFVFKKQRADRGQFFTPEQIVDITIEIIAPKLSDKILDPACGSAGFLSQTIKYVCDTQLKNESQEKINEFIGNNIYGIEINTMAAKIAKMRLLLEGETNSNIVIGDALTDWETINLEFNKVISHKVKSFENYFDIVLTNPPFGSQGKIKNNSILRNYDLGHKWIQNESGFVKTKSLKDGQVPDILFIERCLDFLKPGGKLAIVLPNGDLENTTLSYLRNYIKEKARILSIIGLPSETFIPFGTGIKASVVFLKKKDFSEMDKLREENFTIFFGKITKIGYSGNKNGSPIYKLDNNGKKILKREGTHLIDEDISELKKSIKDYNSGVFKDNEKHYLLKYHDSKDRLDYNYYKPQYRKLNDILLKNNAKELGELVEIVKRKSPILSKKNKKVKYVELSDISSNYSEIMNSSEMFVYELPSRASYELKKGDIVTAIAGINIGTEKHVSAIVTEGFDGCISTNGLRILKPIVDINPYYLLLFLRSRLFQLQVYKYRTGAAIPAISDEDLLKILVYIPTKDIENSIGERVAKSFKLRKEASFILRGIDISLK